jgi:hypothetical protein
MKLFLLFPSLLLTTIILAQSHTIDHYKKYFDEDLCDWSLSFRHFKTSDFKLSKTEKFDNNYAQNFKDLRSFYSIYKPILTFSKDSTRFIDIYSYQLNLEKKGKVFVANPDIDQAILLCNLKTKYWDRIYFGGMSRWIDEALFISDSKFILAGADNDERVTPIIIIGDLSTQSLEIFTNTNKSCTQRKGYVSPKLNRIPITGL